MGDKIYIKKSVDNFVSVDPNSIISDGRVKPREIDTEKLVMYANIEAYITSRTSMTFGDGGGRMVSIASGVINPLENKNKEFLDTSWTESYTYGTSNKIDDSGQSFGITEIDVKIGGINLIPEVNIKFVDIRGKSLFENPNNSPYNAFFHLPWPIFYLSLKGFYGKAVKYRLHLISFSSRFNNDSGNFEVDTKFVGSTYAFLTDIPYIGVLNSPYLYKNINEAPIKENTKTKRYEKKISTNSKGYSTLRNIYEKYKTKNLIDKDFPVKTLRELISVGRRLEYLIEQQLVTQGIDPLVLSDFSKLETSLETLKNSVSAWKKNNIKFGSENYLIDNVNVEDKLDSNNEGSLFFLLKNNFNTIENNESFGVNKNRNNSFATETFSFKNPSSLISYEKDNLGIKVNFDLVENEINDKIKKFSVQQKTIENKLNEIINTITLDGENGLGFRPTIKNIVAVIMANAETYVELLRKVNHRVFENMEKRKSRLDINIQTDSKDNNIYPWSELKIKNTDGTQTLVYPAEESLIKKLESDNPTIWPEVDFVERFYETTIMKIDSNINKEISDDEIDYIFINDDIGFSPTSVYYFINKIGFYQNLNSDDILFDLWKKINNVCYFENFDSATINELAEVEYNNIKNIIEQYSAVVDEIKKTNNYAEFLNKLKTSKTTKYYDFLDRNINYDKDFLVDKYKNTNNNISVDKYVKYQTYLKNLDSNFIITNSDFVINENVKYWLTNTNSNNIFKKFKIGQTYKNILNTPYFHKQLFKDITSSKVKGKYAGSAYFLLNSLEFKEFNENEKLFFKKNEISSSYLLPYFYVLKLGSIYHRYKKFLVEGVDILNDITTKIDGGLFFDNNKNYTYSFSKDYIDFTISKSLNNNIGLNPYYQNMFYYSLFNDNLFDNNISSGFTATIDDGKILINDNLCNGVYGFSVCSKIDSTYTILPSNGGFFSLESDLEILEQDNFRLVWDDEPQNYVSPEYPEYFLPKYDEFFTTNSNTSELNGNFKKINNLIETFSPDILNEFERLFLLFSSDNSIKYNNTVSFTDIIKKITSFEISDTQDNNQLFDILKKAQKSIISDNLYPIIYNDIIKLTISNQNEIDIYVINNIANNIITNTNFNENQVELNKNYIELYLGSFDEKYINFFRVNDIELNVDNIKTNRFLIYKFIKKEYTNTTFKEYLFEIISKKENQISSFFNQVLIKLKKIKTKEDNSDVQSSIINKGYKNDPIKLELYNFFKVFNDRWLVYQNENDTLFEQFLFLDKLNRDVGDLVYINLMKLVHIFEQPNKNKLNLFNLLNALVKESGFNLLVFPSFVNFFDGTEETVNSVFGTFDYVDFKESKPKVLFQYLGLNSKTLANNMSDFKDDSSSMSELLTTNLNKISPTINDFGKSVGFEINFGDINQSIFKNIQLDQTSIKNTTESFEVLERLARSEGGNSVGQMDINLFDYYKVASYTCDIVSMGNVMIQPSMYFELNNIPLFRGTYLIIESSHIIRPGQFNTTFKGVRIPKSSLPNPSDVYYASFRDIFSSIAKKSLDKINSENKAQISQPSDFISSLDTQINGEQQRNLSGNYYGIEYGSDKVFKLVSYQNQEWFKTNVHIVDDFNNSDRKIINRITDATTQTIDVTNSYSVFIENDFSEKIESVNKTLFFNPLTNYYYNINHNKQVSNYKGVIGSDVISNNINGKTIKYGLIITKELSKILNIKENGVIYFKLSD